MQTAISVEELPTEVKDALCTLDHASAGQEERLLEACRKAYIPLLKEQVQTESAGYAEWLRGAIDKHLGPIYRNIKSREQTLDRPFRDLHALRRAYAKYDFWNSIWQGGLRPTPLRHPGLEELQTRAKAQLHQLPRLNEAEVSRVIKRAGNKKGGPDGWSYKTLKSLPPLAIAMIVDFYAEMDATQMLPFQLTCSQIAMLPKTLEKRPISLTLNNFSNVLTLVKKHCSDAEEDYARVMQLKPSAAIHAFRRGAGPWIPVIDSQCHPLP